MAHRDLTARFGERRDRLRRRQLRFKLRHLAGESAALVDGLFQSQKQVRGRFVTSRLDWSPAW